MFRKMKANSLAYAIWVLFSCAVHIVLFNGKVNTAVPLWQKIAMLIAGIMVMLLVHEGIHAVFMKVFRQGKVKMIFGKDKMGIPMPGVLAERRGTKGQEIVMRLAPFLLLTLLPDVTFAFRESVNLFCYVVAVGNCAGCFYDILDVCMLIHGEAW